MSQIALLGAVEMGFVFALVALGVFLSFRVLQFPDLTVDGSFPLGAAVSATLIVSGWDPVSATLVAVLAGAFAGLVTAWLNVRFGILHLLASILTMIALFSVNLRIMGRPNVPLLNQETVITLFAGLDISRVYLKPLVVGVVAILAGLALWRFLVSDYGLAMRATGANPRMARAQGIETRRLIQVGMAMSNGLVALGGAMFAQTAGFADVTTGTGTIVVGLAAVILGETLFRSRLMFVMIFACIAGSIIYRIAIAAALNTDALGLEASDLNLVTAVLVGIALVLPKLRGHVRSLRRGAS